MDPLFELSAERECRNLLLAYARRIDEGDPALAELFVEDGVWERPAGALRGREAVRAEITGRPHDLIMRHVVSNFLFALLDPQHAEGRAHYVSFRDSSASDHPKPLPRPLSAPAFVGDYECQFAQTPEGWRFSRLKFARVFKNPGER